MEALRAICRGDVTASAVAAEVPLCHFKWREDGEHYECLMDKGHRAAKHGQGGMFQKLDD